MKFLKIPLFLVLVVMMSCSKDDNTLTGSLVGTWNIESLDYAGESSSSVGGQTLTTINFEGEGKNMNNQVEFKEDPKEFLSSGSNDATLSMDVDGQTQDVEFEDLEFLISGEWERDGNTLTITNDSTDPQIAEITKLTNDEMTMIYKQEIVQDIFGTELKYSLIGTYTFRKVD